MASPATDAAKTAFPPFDPTWAASTLFWLAVVFGALYWLMSKRGLPQVESIFEARASAIASDLDAAATMQRKAEAAGAAYDEARAKAKANADAIAAKAREEAAAAAESRRKTLEAELNAKLSVADRELAQTKAEALAKVDDIAADTAKLIVERLTGHVPSSTTVQAAVARALKS
jgi:F-type H+-transporting ATPase subunit b